ncbi:XrtA/PEP-CTERM system TPR-repeat protein PrsT [Photobacterium sp. TLY01]|uniref:XrtA/PEP-CTERM system TPR-repeat protein PrsT n=1 Tax=Photobacterium sp. TLY01 TaxID=2907534 RepID=UPI001F40CC81|nr:XrtA/PEP-CTERM system TPR-repeat protein PrsT [Photobacterium sp. TLY01]UIP30122.1 PEP-CTERM system TPR-repeat protein PrsT [Photobacterium sp. TLY01]
MAFLPRTTFHVLALAGVIAVTLTACGEQSVDEYMTKAETYLSNNQINAAVIELKNAIQQHPDANQARLMLGQIYLDQGDYASAEKELFKALRSSEEKDSIEPLLAQAYLGQKKTTDIIDLAQHPQSRQAEALADIYAIESLALLLDDDPDGAEQAYQRAENTGQITLYTRLARASLDATSELNDTALSQVSNIVRVYPASSDAWLLKGHIETSMGHHKDAAQSYRKAVDTAPKAIQNTLFLAQALVKTEQYKEAEKYVDHLLTVFSGHVLSNELKATILYAEEKQAEAKVHADLAIRNGSRNLPTYLISGVVAYHQGNFEQANERFEKVAPFVSQNHMIQRLYASSQLKLGDIEGALQTMNQFDATDKASSDFISDMSLELAKIGRKDAAMSLAEKANHSPTTSKQLRLGLLQLASNDTTGVDTLQQILETDPNLTEANLGLAYYYLKQGRINDVQQIVSTWLERNPDDQTAQMLNALVLQIEKKPDQAQAIYQQVLAKDPKNLQATLGLGQIAASHNDVATAFGYARTAYSHDPGRNLTTRALYKYGQLSGQLDEAVSLVASQVEAHPDDTALKLDLARGYMLQKKPDQALSLMTSLTPQQQTAQSWRLLGDIYFSQRDYRQAEQAYAQWLAQDVLSQQAYMRNIQIKELNNKMRDSLLLAEKAEQLFQNTAVFSLMKAGLQLKMDNASASQATLDALPDKVKAQAYFMRLQALNYLRRKDFTRAIEWQRKRYDASPGIASANDVASAYSLNQQTDEAIKFLQGVIQEYGDKAAPLRLTLAQLQFEQQPEQAIAQYRHILEQQPDNVVALNNLAWLYLSQEKYPQACDSASKALGLAQEHPQIQDTYGYCLLKSGQAATALPMLEKAYRQAQTNPEIALHYAESLLANDMKENAREVLIGVSTSDPELQTLKNKLEEQIRL